MQFQPEIYELLGERIIKELFQFIRAGTVGRMEVQKLSGRMETMTVFNACMSRQANLIDTLSDMLDRWYQYEMFALSPDKAQASLVDMLSSSCPQIVVENIKNLTDRGQPSLPPYRDVPDMLRRLDLAELVPIFIKEELDFSDVADLTSEDLIEIGVTKLKQRKIIVKAAEGLKHQL